MAGGISAAYYVAAAVAAVGVGYGVYSGEKAADEQKKARRVQRRIEAVKSQRERINALSQTQVERARLEAAAASEGSGASSGVQGAAGALASNTNANIAFANQLTALNDQRLSYLSNAETASNRANLGFQVYSVASAYQPKPKSGPPPQPNLATPVTPG